MGTKNKIYKALSTSNDINAVRKGKVVKRAKNKFILKFIRGLFR